MQEPAPASTLHYCMNLHHTPKRFFIRSVFAFGLAALALPFASLQASAQSRAQPLKILPNAEILQLLQAGGLTLFFRHAATDFSQKDQEPIADYANCALQRNLNAQGRIDARLTGEAFRQLGIPVGDVIASPYCRTVQSAELAFGRVTVSTAAYDDALLPLLTQKPSTPGHRIIMSHGNPLIDLVGRPVLDEGEAALVRGLGSAVSSHSLHSFEIVARIRVADWASLMAVNPR